MTRLIDHTGQRFGRLLVIERGPDVGTPRPRAAWNCICDCGNAALVTGECLRRANTRSCGCLEREAREAHLATIPGRPGLGTTHGACGKGKRGIGMWPEYRTWQAMKARCTNLRHRAYPGYGGRGITVCDRWLHSFPNFIADMGRKPSASASIDRIDPNGNYEPSNCRWATPSEQCRNRRPYKWRRNYATA